MSKLPERCARQGLGWLLGLAVGIGCCATAPAQSPAWWTNRGVLVTNLAPSDYALANQGQVKWLATNAYEEFQLLLPGDNSALHDAVSGFTQTGNYLPVNLGQLKALAKPFYDRITAVAAGEPYLTNARPTGVTTNYPWTYTITDDADYAPANLGQVKYVWSIDFDRDADGLPDWWEVRVFGNLSQGLHDDPDGDGCDNLCEYQQGSDPGDYFNHVLPYLEIVSKHRHCTVSNWLALPLVIRATDSNAVGLVNAPLTFAVTNGTAQFTSCTNGPMSTNLFLRTDADGLAETWLFLPTNAVVTNFITVTAQSGTNQTQMQLLVWLEDAEGQFYTFKLDTNGPSIGLASAGTILWQNHNSFIHLNGLTNPVCIASTNCGYCETSCGRPPNHGNPTNGFCEYKPYTRIYCSNELWLEISSVTNSGVGLTNKTSNLIVHPPYTYNFYDFYDLFGTTNLTTNVSGLNLTNWVWLLRTVPGQTNVVVTTTWPDKGFFVLGTMLDSDGDGLTDAYENLVSHTATNVFNNLDMDGDGIPDALEMSLGINPKEDEPSQTGKRLNYIHDSAGRLQNVSGARNETVGSDAEGNVQ